MITTLPDTRSEDYAATVLDVDATTVTLAAHVGPWADVETHVTVTVSLPDLLAAVLPAHMVRYVSALVEANEDAREGYDVSEDQADAARDLWAAAERAAWRQAGTAVRVSDDYADHVGRTVYRIAREGRRVVLSAPSDAAALHYAREHIPAPWSLSEVTVPPTYPREPVAYRWVRGRSE